MNWTGGRLRRHSDIHAKNKKQHFKEPRSAAKGLFTTLFKAPSPLKENRVRGSDPSDESRQNSDQQSRNTSSRSYSGNPNIAPATHEPSQAARRLDTIKRRLLEKSDWASVAAARPLKVLFPPAEALRKFGRRRRITDDDRERLRSSDSRPNIARNTRLSEDAVSDIETIPNLDIRINGRPAGADRSITNRSLPANVSSQSMLLDCEEATPAKETPFMQESDRPYVDGRNPFDDRSWILRSSSVSLLCSSPTRRLSSLDDSILGSAYLTDESRNEDESRDIELESLHSDCSSDVSLRTPIRRRFTIDDQILAEQEGKLNICNASMGADRYGARQQFESTLHLERSSPVFDSSSHRTTHESTGTSSTLNHSGYGWLSEPPYNIQRPISRVDKGLGSRPCGPKFHEDGLSQLSTMAQQSASPVKLYGQSAILDGDRIAGNVDCYRDRRAEPNFTSPVASGAGQGNTFRTDSFAMSPNALVFKPIIPPRAGIYIDQARVAAGNRVFLTNTGMQPQKCSREYLRPTSRRRD
ncbi:hypothetical protein BO94DRAFT_624706 [Aspergillus sclerotioniger CBS 115572]|uniref:Uncharacterized protein n=1 Tax=Aspergillus sclerotioniger CBS 115572 TaxID=1450535 RepID=A0A317WN51_9EURO|nr:hypothetical protein BO94DRAFT_624706 [Aspergillus sclerotioniger CBS 115572]PWY86517.1 hypothetical protein BO94DRAFT_624706 [Aspergillus sclerotioniger CBS 115572]